MNSNGQSLLQIRDLAVEFTTDDGIVQAVNGVSYDVPAGHAIGIVGESGSGKSVSQLAVMRLVARPAGRITSGEVLFEGTNLLDLNDAEMRRVRGNQIAMIFQDPMNSLNPVYTVGKQIEESLRLHQGVTKIEARARAVELLDLVGIPSPADRIKDYPHQLSGGMQQRAMIAMAISCNPQLLIADEPSTALDVTIQAQVIELLAELRSKLNMAVILITHDLALVAGFCDEVAVMYAGYIVEQGPARDIFYNPKHPYTLGLLGSVPNLTSDRTERLTAIPGTPPDMLALPVGCPYADRCSFARDECRTSVPTLDEIDDKHTIRCLVDVSTGNLR